MQTRYPSIHSRCAIPGFTIDVQQEHENFFAGRPAEELIIDNYIWVEIIYDGSNPFVQLDACSWLFLILHAKEPNVVAHTATETEFDTIILHPGSALRGIIVSEQLKKIKVPTGISYVLMFQCPEKKIELFTNILVPYGSS